MAPAGTSNNSSPSFPNALPPEVLDLFVDFCDDEALHSLNLTCKKFYETTVLAIKYRKVNISAHNLGHIPCTQWNGSVRYYWSDRYPPKFDVENLSREQHQFLNSVLDRPYLGKLVHDFTWTIRSYCDPDGYWPGRVTKDAVYPDTHMWNAFKSLSNVNKLDLACHQETWDWDYLRQPPKELFPAVTDLRLSGIMYRRIVETILNCINPSKLEHLSLDNLQDPGRSGEEYPYRCSADGSFTQVTQDTDEVKLPGTMRGILPLLDGQSTRLRSLYYRKPGWLQPLSGMSATQDEECYIELGSFLRDVHSTVETFHFEHGVLEHVAERLRRGEDLPPPGHNRVWIGQRPKDSRFLAHIFPVLMEADWPELRELEITCVGTRKTPAITPTMKARLKKHLGKGVTVQYADVGDKPCEEFKGEVAR